MPIVAMQGVVGSFGYKGKVTCRVDYCTAPIFNFPVNFWAILFKMKEQELGINCKHLRSTDFCRPVKT